MFTPSRSPHVLVIDDTQEILDLVRELLEDEGYQVSTSQALLDLSKVKDLSPDVIVQDLLFEGSSEIGWKFLVLSRLDPMVAHIPLILCTAAVQVVRDDQMAAHLARNGVRVVLKPFNIDELLVALAEVLAVRQATELLARSPNRTDTALEPGEQRMDGHSTEGADRASPLALAAIVFPQNR